MAPTAATVDDYIAGFPEATQEVLQELRRRVHAAVPDAEERISYQIPTFAVDGQYVIYVAAGGDFSLNLVAGKSNVRRYDPTDGTETSMGTATGGGVRAFSVPADHDYTVYLKRIP